jgi:succinate dehydrogenase / fumarate reductase flavoprotein subunit
MSTAFVEPHALRPEDRDGAPREQTVLDSRIPPGPIEQKWDRCRFDMKLVNPANRRKHTVLIVGSGLAGAAAAATLGQQGYHVHCFSYHDTSRRPHSIAAQGGINAAKNYRNDGDSVMRLFSDTVKGGDFRSREANSYWLAEVSVNIIDQCVAQGVPFARDFGGLLETRSFGGVQVQRTFYARGQTGQQLLLGAYQALEQQIQAGAVTMHTRTEMLDLVVVDGKARGIVTRDLRTGAIRSHVGEVMLCTGGYSNVFFLSTNAKASNCTAIWRAHRRGALFGNPCYTQIHPTCIPQSGEYQSKLVLMSESLRNDGRIWVPKKKGETRRAGDVPESERDYDLERRYPSFGNLVPRDVASRNAKEVCDEGRGVGPGGHGVYLDFADAIGRLGLDVVRERYGNLFEIYERITGDNAYDVPMRIYPAPHYTMGGLWVDYHLMTTVTGLFAGGEANFSDQGANRLGASALMQGLSDGYSILPATVPGYLARPPVEKVDPSHPAFREAEEEVRRRTHAMLQADGRRTVDSFHRELGKFMWDDCGMARSDAGLHKALARIPELREEFHKSVRVLGTGEELNQSLEKAGRVADLLELGELMCLDALHRTESCGGHFRVESQTAEGGAARRRQLLLRRRVAVAGAGQGPGTAQGAADLRVRSPDYRGVTNEAHLENLAAEGHGHGGTVPHLPGR